MNLDVDLSSLIVLGIIWVYLIWKCMDFSSRKFPNIIWFLLLQCLRSLVIPISWVLDFPAEPLRYFVCLLSIFNFAIYFNFMLITRNLIFLPYFHLMGTVSLWDIISIFFISNSVLLPIFYHSWFPFCRVWPIRLCSLSFVLELFPQRSGYSWLPTYT